MSTRIGLSWMLAGLSLIAACAEDPAKLTQIVVVVDSDLTVPEQLDYVQIEVSGTKKPRVIDAAVEGEQQKLPQTLGLVYSGGPLGPVHVVARGWHEGKMIVERVADVEFKKDQTLKLALRLTRACALRPACEATNETCEEGNCVSTSMSLPEFDGNDGTLFPDASAWSPEGGPFDGDSSLPNDADGGGDAGPDGAVAGPVCTINLPADGELFYAGDTVRFEGRCVDPDGADVALQWKSTLAKKLGNGATFTNNKLAVGTHEISLCATGTDSCTTRQIEIAAVPELSATIGAFVQPGSTDYVFRADADLVVNGEGTGVPPLELTWIDSFAGEIGKGAQITFSQPMVPGRHLLRLRVKDAHDRVKTVERGFVVHAPGRTKLFEAYDAANPGLIGEVTALASDGIFHYVGSDSGHLFRVVADITDSTPMTVTATATMMSTRPEVRGLYLHSSANRLYMATSKDVQSCDVTNGTVKNCAALMLGNFGMSEPRCVRRLSVEGTDYLTVGTTAGLWVAPNSMLPMGTLRETGAEFHSLTEGGGRLWIAGSNGLSSYSLASGALSGNPQKFPGATGTLKEIVASADHIWATLSSGFTRYDESGDTWFTWTNSYTDAEFGRLVNDDVRSIAITRPVIDGVTHEVIWIGTSAGLSRFDPMVSSFTTYSMSDGLPNNTVLRMVGLPSNELLLATPLGLAIHRGQ